MKSMVMGSPMLPDQALCIRGNPSWSSICRGHPSVSSDRSGHNWVGQLPDCYQNTAQIYQHGSKLKTADCQLWMDTLVIRHLPNYIDSLVISDLQSVGIMTSPWWELPVLQSLIKGEQVYIWYISQMIHLHWFAFLITWSHSNIQMHMPSSL